MAMNGSEVQFLESMSIIVALKDPRHVVFFVIALLKI